MIFHLFKLIRNQWKSNVWIMAELFISLICLCAVTTSLYTLVSRYWIDKGFDMNHVYMASYVKKPVDSPDYDTIRDNVADLRELAARIRKCPEIDAVGFTTNDAFPYSLNTSTDVFYGDSARVYAVHGTLTPEIVDVLRLSSPVAGIDLKKEVKNGTWLISESAMAELYGKNVVLAHLYKNKKKTETIPCVLANYINNEYNNIKECIWKIESEANLIGKKHDNFTMPVLLFRVKPEADYNFHDFFFSSLRNQLVSGNHVIVDITPVNEHRNSLLNMSGVNMLYGTGYFLCLFFIVCILLGIIGTFWFRTEARTSEIGLRMALGATRKQIRNQMWGEGLLLFSLVWFPGVIIFYLIHDTFKLYETSLSGWAFCLTVMLIVTLFMVLLIMVGIWYPARRASRINPVDALHYE